MKAPMRLKQKKEVEQQWVKHLEEGKDAFQCPITTLLMADPVVASDGYTYEKRGYNTMD